MTIPCKYAIFSLSSDSKTKLRMKNIAVLLTVVSLATSVVAGVPTGTVGAKDAVVVHVAPLTYNNGGTPKPVPEVQEFAAMAGAVLVGLEALRRRRNARKV